MRYPTTKLLSILAELWALADPKNFQAQSDVGFGHLKIAEVMTMLRKHQEALASHKIALKIRQSQAAEVADDAQAQTDLFQSYCLLSEASIEAEEYSNAAQWLTKAREKLASMQAKGWYTNAEEMLGQEKVNEVQSKLNDGLEVCEQADKAIADIEFAVNQVQRWLHTSFVLTSEMRSKETSLNERKGPSIDMSFGWNSKRRTRT